MTINTVSDLLKLRMFKDKEYTECQVYNSKGELISCCYFDEVLEKYGDKPFKNVDASSGMFFISLGGNKYVINNNR